MSSCGVVPELNVDEGLNVSVCSLSSFPLAPAIPITDTSVFGMAMEVSCSQLLNARSHCTAEAPPKFARLAMVLRE